MKYIVEYKLHGSEIPYFIADGGYFPNGGKLIGITKDSANCHVPSSELVKFESKSAFADHIASLSLKSIHNVQLNDEQKREVADKFWDSKQ